MKRISIIPFKKETVTNKIEIERLFEKVRNNTLFNSKLDVQSTANTGMKELEGVINEKAFKIRRILPFGYSAFMLIVNGEIKEEDLVITYKFHSRVNIFLTLSIGFLLVISLYSFDILSALSSPILLLDIQYKTGDSVKLRC